ncbi:MAG: hypothetical protein ACWGOV_01665 [Acidiferrobacterales bacterium]
MITGNRSFFVVLATLFLALSAPLAKADIVKDMVHLDQVYIPVLAMTSDEKLQPARAAMKSLKPVWQSFNHKYGTYGDDPNWETDMDKIGARIDAAGKIIARGTRLKDAHEELEHVRMIFLNMRDRNAIDYFIDYLTRFHEPMEEIVLTVKGKTPDKLSASDIDRIKHVLPRAMLLWDATSAAKFDPAVYEFNKKQTEALRGLIKNEQQALANLDDALKANDKKKIIAAGVAIKPNFAKVFKSFGRFPSGL